MVIHPVPIYAARPKEEARSTAEATAQFAADEKRELVTVLQAARLLGKSRDTIYRWLTEGRLEGRKVGGRWLVYRDGVEEQWRAGFVEPQRD